MELNTKIIQSIEYHCFDVYLTSENKVLDINLIEIKPKLNNCSYVYFVSGKYRTIKWIKENGVNVVNFIGE